MKIASYFARRAMRQLRIALALRDAAALAQEPNLTQTPALRAEECRRRSQTSPKGATRRRSANLPAASAHPIRLPRLPNLLIGSLLVVHLSNHVSAGESTCDGPTWIQAIDLTAPGAECDAPLPCIASYDSSGCDAPIEPLYCPDEIQVGSTLWLSFQLQNEEIGTCTVYHCADESFDSVMRVYRNTGLVESQLGCVADSCETSLQGAGITFDCSACNRYFISIDGIQGASGTGTVEIHFAPFENVSAAFSCISIPLANPRFDVHGNSKPCLVDGDCKAGETGPDPQTVCRDSDGDGQSDSCYVARQRYISIGHHPSSAGAQVGYRIGLLTGVAGNVALGFAGPPYQTNLAGPGGGHVHYSRIVDEPHFMDWTSLSTQTLHIGDCEISPGHTYVIQTIGFGSDPSDSSSASPPLILPTAAHWGDVTGGGNPGGPPNGATGTLSDVFAMIKGFQNTENEPKLWLDINPASGANSATNVVLNLGDAFEGILAFQNNPYPGPAPTDCP